MSADTHTRPDAAARSRPLCPFCQAAWTDGMVAEFERFSTGSCCGGHHTAEDHVPLALPQRDLCCSACGKAIYLMPGHDHA